MHETKTIQKQWLDQIKEDIIDPTREIVDPHHHLLIDSIVPQYLLDDLWEDTQSGHNIKKTVFIECGVEYKTDGPEHLRPVGETEFVAAIAKASMGHGKAEISAIVAYADLAGDKVQEVLDAHKQAGNGIFVGIRHAGPNDDAGDAGWLADAHTDLYLDADFQKGVALLGQNGLSYDTWHYHTHNKKYAALARACPDTQFIFDHFGTPIGKGQYEGKRAEVFKQWKQDVADIAKCENVVAKLGGLAMPPNGYGWDERSTPATSDEIVAAHREYYIHMIDCFGPDRCMLESNFPVDKMSMSYPVYWNAAKKITAEFSENEKTKMFSGTATRIYKL